MKHRFFEIIGLFCAVVGLAGCGRGAAEPPGVVHLAVWSMWTGAEEENFKKVLEKYHTSHPNIVVDNLGAIRDDTKSVRAIVAGVPPDLLTLADAMYLGPLAANGGLMELDDWFKQSGFKEQDFVEAGLYQCRYRGRLYAMPYMIDCQALLWNRAEFRAAGLDPERPPATLEELEQFARKLTLHDATGNLTQIGFAPLNNKSFWAGDIYLIFNLFGGGIYDDRAGRITPDNPANVQAMKWYTGLVDAMGGSTKVNAFAAGFGQAQGGSNAFFMGKAAMMVNGEWNPYWATKYAPGLEYGVAPMPAPAARPDRKRSTWFGGNLFCIPKGSKHAKEAWELLAWMQSDEAQVFFADAMNNVPNRVSALKSPKLREGAPYREKYARYLDLADSPNGMAFPALPVSNLYATAISDALDVVLDKQKTPEQALRDVRLRVEKEINRF